MPARFAIIGDPVAHSLSPMLHGAAFVALGIDATYERVQVRADELPAVWERRLRHAYTGFNITMPHKSAAIPLLDAIDDAARSVGAVNTVTNRNGKLEGTNTDIVGIQRSLHPYLGSCHEMPAVIIGAGGTARAATAALSSEMAPTALTYLVREPSRADPLLRLARAMLDCPVTAARLDDPTAARILDSARLIIQTTPVGMVPDAGRSPLPFAHAFTPEHTVFDVIYRPFETAFLAAARRSGARVVGGLELFLHQGAAAFEVWTGRIMPLEVVRPAVVRALGT